MEGLYNIDWVSLPNVPYIMKYFFNGTGYHIMVSNLTSLYSEELNITSILIRVSELNPFVQMKKTVVLEHLKKALEKCLNQESQLGMNLISDKLIFSLEFPAGLVSCKYNFEMNLLDAEQICEHIISPTIFNALLSQRKILELQKKILANESTKSSLTSNISSPDPMNPELLKGKNISTKDLLESFMKLQICFKEQQIENLQAYNASRKEKSKNDHSVPSLSANKKLKLPESLDGESSSIKFEDNDERLSIKEEETTCGDNVTSQTKSNIVKKKKLFKI